MATRKPPVNLFVSSLPEARIGGGLQLDPTQSSTLGTNCYGSGDVYSLNDRVQTDIELITRSVDKMKGHPLYGQNKFWENLGRKHAQMIHEFGFESFKRTVNFTYGQWRVHPFLWDPKIRHLLWAFIRHVRMPSALFSARVDPVDVPGDRTFSPVAYRIFLALLWQWALFDDKLGCLDICDEPRLGQPIPVWYRHRLISQDLAQSSLEANAIARYLPLHKVGRIMEIGAGYGRLAHVVAKVFPAVRYSIFDIPPALAISQNYLGESLGWDHVTAFAESTDPRDLELETQVTAFLPHQLAQFPNGYFELAINISSFDEMTAEQVNCYFDLIESKCSGWLYVKGYKNSRTGGMGIGALPYRKHWRCIYRGADPVTASFEERIIRLH